LVYRSHCFHRLRHERNAVEQRNRDETKDQRHHDDDKRPYTGVYLIGS